MLCIIEAMKLMNEIESEYDGEVPTCTSTRLPVQYGERLFAIKVRRRSDVRFVRSFVTVGIVRTVRIVSQTTVSSAGLLSFTKRDVQRIRRALKREGQVVGVGPQHID